MSDIEKAISLFSTGKYTCVLVKDDEIFSSSLGGVAPMLEFIKNGVNLNGFSVADKIVGKAVALLFILAGVKEVFAAVMSRQAEEILASHGVRFSFETETEAIINRAGTGPCPMENAVSGIDDPREAYAAISRTLEVLRSEKRKII